MRRWILPVVAALMLVACVEPVSEDATGNEVYASMCARCHGSDLGGGIGPALGAGSELADKPDEYLISTITNGRGRMPSFRSSLGEEQIRRVADYLREQQAG